MLSYRLYTGYFNPATMRAIGWYALFIVAILAVTHTAILYIGAAITQIFRGYVNLDQHMLPIIIACALPFIFAATKDSWLDREIGELSYPLYLVHIGIMLFVLPNPIPWGGEIIAGLSLAWAAALALLTRPIERWRRLPATGLRAAPAE